MPQLINPRTDEGFKIIFGQKESKKFLIGFLNAVFMGSPVITDVEYNPNEVSPMFQRGYKYIFDIHCVTQDGTRLIVEMQKCHHENFKERCLRYMCSDIISHHYRGDSIGKKEQQIIGIFIMDFIPPDESEPKVRRDIALREAGCVEPYIDAMRMIFISLPLVPAKEEDCVSDFDRWTFILENMERMQNLPFKEHDLVFNELEQVANIESLTADQRRAYMYSVDLYNIAKEQEEKKLNEGMAKGMAEGMAKGMAKGLAEGARKEKISMVMNMLSLGLSPEIIAKASGMTLDEVQALSKPSKA